ncbi:MAG: class I SAM-dependent methyltransferase [Candidatus ainarchaeum sp.]|nr:class I SAM-dependent methyltransferase [Candidatus ainarchaeum sp.]
MKKNYENKVKKYYANMAKTMKAASGLYKIRLELINKYITSESIVFDAGCGNGIYTVPMSNKAEKIIAVDFSQEMLSEFAKSIEKQNLKNITLVQGNLLNLSFKNNYFDMVTCFSTCYYIEAFDSVIKELNRVLKKGGLLILDCGISHSLNALYSKKRFKVPQFFVSNKKLKHTLNVCGFDIVEERTFEIIPRVGINILKKGLDLIICNKMVDELISSMPILKYFSFRRFVVCKKR